MREDDHDKPGIAGDDSDSPAERDDVLERAAKELGVTYEELRSAVEF